MKSRRFLLDLIWTNSFRLVSQQEHLFRTGPNLTYFHYRNPTNSEPINQDVHLRICEYSAFIVSESVVGSNEQDT